MFPIVSGLFRSVGYLSARLAPATQLRVVPLIRDIHEARVHSRRVTILARHLAEIMPHAAAVLDIGAGDGLLASHVLAVRQDLQWTGVDALARPNARIPVQIFDGRRLPFDDRTFDVALFVDVLHHTDDPMSILREAIRVSRRNVVIKDHLREGFLAGPTLRFMDWVGNAGWGVSLPYNYWTEHQWNRAFGELSLEPTRVERSLGLYPWWADWLFGRSLHFLTRFEIRSSGTIATGEE